MKDFTVLKAATPVGNKAKQATSGWLSPQDGNVLVTTV